MSASDASTDNYTLSLELQTPDALKIMRGMLDTIDSSNKGITRVSFEIESKKPFEERSVQELKPEKENKVESKSELTDESDTVVDNKNALEAFPPDSTKFKISSVLLSEDKPMVIKEIKSILENTNWETSKKRIGHKLRDLLEEDRVIRERREVDNLGSNPYEYQLTEHAKEQVKAVEKHVVDSAEFETYDELESVSLDYECEICGEKFQTASGLGSHKHFKHSQDNESQQKDLGEIDEESSSKIISTDTERFYAMSVLYNSAKPVTSNDVASRLEDTEWESNTSSLSATLGQLESAGLLNREKRHSERGNPYEYTITDLGKETIENSIEQARKEDENTFEEIIEGK